MPLHGHHSSSHNLHDAPLNTSSHATLPGMIHAAQTLGAVGAPSSTLRPGSQATPSTDPDGLFLPPSSSDDAKERFARAQVPGTGSDHQNSPQILEPFHQRTSIMSNPAQSFESRRTGAFGRQPEELHIPVASATNSDMSRQPSSHDYLIPSEVVPSHLPSLNVQSSNSHTGTYGSGGACTNPLPGALQPGNTHRPAAISANTAPSILPTLPQLSTQVQSHQRQPSTPQSGMVNSHSHSRSSPAGFEAPKYKQQGTGENAKYPSSPGAGYAPQTPQGSKYSPLGLADIRPGAESLLMDVTSGPGPVPYNGEPQVPTNSNYLAPWPIYAVDWCKWPVSGASSSFGGKIALGSYLEDNHNYVWIFDLLVLVFVSVLKSTL